VKIFALFGRPEFLRRLHGWAAVLWFVASFPLAWWLGSSVVFVTFLSLYAIVTGHWSSWQAARVETRQDEEINRG
jgi:cytosine/uracil/thiamine/allantoin permease